MRLGFLKEATNIILVGPNGVGKSTIARNIAHQSVLNGCTVLFTSAGHMLNDLAAQEGDSALKRRLSHYARPQLLVIDEVGYLSYSNRHADLLFEIVSRRYEERSTLVTTNRPFTEWGALQENFFGLHYKTLHTHRSSTPQRMALLETGGRTPGCVYNISTSLYINHNKYLCDFMSQITLQIT